MLEPIQPPDVFPDEPGAPVDLGTAKADFWLEDNAGKRFREMKDVDVRGAQLLRPRDRVHLTISGITSDEIMRAFCDNSKAFIKFQGKTPIECICQDNDDTSSIWEPLEVPLEIQHSSDSGFSIEFVLFGFPYYGKQERAMKQRYGQILLNNETWGIQICAHSKTTEWHKEIKQSRRLAATHVGCIRKKDHGEISWEDTQNIIGCLRHFLSFAIGSWQPIGHIRLLSKDGICMHESWGLTLDENQVVHNGSTWSSGPSAHKLSEIFEGFWGLWNDPEWIEILPDIIYWYLQANLGGKGTLRVDSALILSHAALEKLSWFYATQIKKNVYGEDYQSGKLPASEQFRRLATLANLPHEIPDILDSLKSDANEKSFHDAFHSIAEIRNQLVHPKKKHELKPLTIFQTWNLSQWYVEMCLLWMMQYQGRCANRLHVSRVAGETELVPWATPSKENDT